MVKKLTIGVIGIQGAVSEHIISMENTLKQNNILGEVILVKDKNLINEVDALILPGGESTTISRQLYKSGIYDVMYEKTKKESLPIMGTCAGCVLLASELTDDNKDVKLLSAMDMKVKRNAFGRQRESFEKNINIKGFSEPYNAVFIRAPIIERVWGNCEILAEVENKIVMARQDNFLALSFHPELTDDFRINKYFLDAILSFHYR